MRMEDRIYKVDGKFYIGVTHEHRVGDCARLCALHDLSCRACGSGYYVLYEGPEPEVASIEVREDYDGTAPGRTAGKLAESWTFRPGHQREWALKLTNETRDFYYEESELNITYKKGELKMGKEWFRVKTREEMEGEDFSQSPTFTVPMQKYTFGAIPFKILDPTSDRPKLYFNLPDGKTDFWNYRKDWLVPIQVEERETTTKKVISPASKLMKILEVRGFVFERGHWRNGLSPVFNPAMFAYCGQEVGEDHLYTWRDEWLETTTEKRLVEVDNPKAEPKAGPKKVPFRLFLQEWMILKQEHTVPEYLNSRDLLQLSSLGDTCLKNAQAVLDSIRVKLDGEERDKMLSLFQSSVCPFCKIVDDECKICEYGRRHGICNQSGAEYPRAIASIERKDNSAKSEFIEAVRELVNNVELI